MHDCTCNQYVRHVPARTAYTNMYREYSYVLHALYHCCVPLFLPFFIQFIMFALTFSLPPTVVVTQIRGHIAGSSSPLPTTVRALHFYREKISALSSLVDSRRIAPTQAIDALSSWSFSIFAKKFTISPRWDSNSRTNASSIRGYCNLGHRAEPHGPE